MSSYLWRFHLFEYLLHSNEYAILWQVIFSVRKRAMQDEDVSDGAGLSLYTAEIWAGMLTSLPLSSTRALATCLASWPEWPDQLLCTIRTFLEPGASAAIASSSDQDALCVAITDKGILVSVRLEPCSSGFPRDYLGGYSLHHRGWGGVGVGCFCLRGGWTWPMGDGVQEGASRSSLTSFPGWSVQRCRELYASSQDILGDQALSYSDCRAAAHSVFYLSSSLFLLPCDCIPPQSSISTWAFVSGGFLDQWSPTFLATGTSFGKTAFSTDHEGVMVSGWFKHVTLFVHFVSIIIASAPSQICRH